MTDFSRNFEIVEETNSKGPTTWQVESEPTVDRSQRYVPIGAPNLTSAERACVLQALDAGMLSGTASIVQEFEERFARTIGCRHAVSCNSGGMALLLMLRALGVGPGDEVIVPSFTMIATAAAVSLLGATPVFADCDENTLNLDPESVSRCLSSRTAAVICVHLYGHPCDMAAIGLAAGDVCVVEDAAEAHGACWRGRPCGSLSRAGAFSFYANKVMVCGEGGMITTDDDELASRASSLRHYCFQAGRHFWHMDLGFSARLPALAAAVGLAQTRRLQELHSDRQAAANHYTELFRTTLILSADKTLKLDEHSQHGWWHYWVRLNNRSDVRAALASSGIETRPGFVPLHVQPCYTDGTRPSRTDPTGCPNAERAGRSVLLLPTHQAVAPETRELIADTVINSWDGVP